MTNEDKNSDASTDAGNSQAFPMFYKQPEALTSEQHKDLRFDASIGLSLPRTHM